MRTPTTLLATFALAATAAASIDGRTHAPSRAVPESLRAPTQTPPPVPAPVRASPGLFDAGALFDETPEGLWAAHARWKAYFAGDTTTFVPFFGSRAPHNQPVSFTVEWISVGGTILPSRAVGVSRVGQRVHVERGFVDEGYVLHAEGVEQVFTIDARVTGEVRVRIAVAGDYELHATEAGIELLGELGRVRYGEAFVVDAAGARTAIATELDGPALELVVPAEVVATAAFPLTIDPLIAAYDVGTSVADEIEPDVAYEDATGWYVHVAERVFSATDSDVFSWASDDVQLWPGSQRIVDASTTRWQRPRVASNLAGTTFTVVAAVGPDGLRSIRTRTCDAVSWSYAAPVIASGPEAGDKLNPVIGGDASGEAGTGYLVAWQRALSATDHDIHARRLDDQGSPEGGLMLLDNSIATLDTRPAISRSNGRGHAAAREWTVVWEREYSAIDRDVYGVQVHWNGTLTHTTFPVSTSTRDESNPCVSTILDGGAEPRAYLVVTESLAAANDHDLMAFLMRGSTKLATQDVIAVGQPGQVTYDQIRPATDGTGIGFLLTFTQRVAGLDHDMWYVNLQASGDQLVQSGLIFAFDTDDGIARSPAVTAKRSGGEDSRRLAIVYAEVAGTSDTRAVIVDLPAVGNVVPFCGGAQAPCPCGNTGSVNNGCANSLFASGAGLLHSGDPSVSHDTFVLTATQIPPGAPALFFQGSAMIQDGLGSAFGDGLRCAGGAVVRLGTKAATGAGQAVHPEVGDVDISVMGLLPDAGGTRYYQVWYRNAAPFCTAATFNLTNGLRVAWVL